MIFAMLLVFPISDYARAGIFEDVVISNDVNDDMFADVTIDDSGVFYLAGLDYQTKIIHVVNSSNYGGTFNLLSDDDISLGSTGNAAASIAVSKNKNAFVAFKNITATSENKLCLSVYTTAKSSWTANLSNYMTIDSEVDVATASSANYDIVALAYARTISDYQDIFLYISTDGGQSWKAERKITSDGTPFTPTMGTPSIAVRYPGSGSVFYFMVGYRDLQTLFTWTDTFDASTSVWGEGHVEMLATGSLFASSAPKVAYGTTTMAYVTYSDTGSNYVYLKYASSYGMTTPWTEKIVDNNGHASQPVVCANGDNVYLAWKDSRLEYSFGDIFYSYSTDRGATFSTCERINRDYLSSKTQQNPAICVFQNDIYVAWEHITSNTDLRMRHMLAPAAQPKSSNYWLTEIDYLKNNAGMRVQMPVFTVNDITFFGDYVILVGQDLSSKGRVAIINTATSTLTFDYSDATAISFNSVTIDPANKLAIVVGQNFVSSATSGVWYIKDVTQAPPALLKLTPSGDHAWVDDYSSFSEVYYFPSEPCFMVGSSTSNVCISVRFSPDPMQVSWQATATTLSYPVEAISHEGADSMGNYYVFTYNAGSSENYYSICTGSIGSMVTGSTTIPGITGRVNDAAYVGLVDYKYRTFIASNGGLFRMNTLLDSALDSCNYIDVDGDGGSNEFDYEALSYCADVGGPDKLVAAGGISIGGSVKGFYTVLANVEKTSVAEMYTEIFNVTGHAGAYPAVAMRASGDIHLGGSYQIINYDYYGDDTLGLTVENVPPTATNFKIDYATVDYASARTHAQLIPNGANQIAIWIDIVDDNSRDEITTVVLQAWHDGDGSVVWPGTGGSDHNGVLQITYTQGSGFVLDYPTGVARNEVTLGTCTEQNIDDRTKRLEFVWCPGQQARYGEDGSATIGADSGTWNVQFVCDDIPGIPVTVTNPDWEFGYVRVTYLEGIVAASIPSTAPGGGEGNAGDSNEFTLSWSSNWKYRLGVRMTTSLFHSGPPVDIIDATDVYVVAASGETAGYDAPSWAGELPHAGYKTFSSVNNWVYWYDDGSGGYNAVAPQSGNSQVFTSSFRVYVKYGSMAGSYTAQMQYVVDIL